MKRLIINFLLLYAIIFTLVGIVLDALLFTSYEPSFRTYIIFAILSFPALAIGVYLGFKKETEHKLTAAILLVIATLALSFFIGVSIYVLR